VACETDVELEVALQRVEREPWYLQHGALVQELVPPTGYDLRLVVAGNRVVGWPKSPSFVRDVPAPGGVFGEIALLASGHRTASVVATSPMRLITLFKRDVWALENEMPRLADALRATTLDRLVARSAGSVG
jgi:CRP-like cAMP-binding protein